MTDQQTDLIFAPSLLSESEVKTICRSRLLYESVKFRVLHIKNNKVNKLTDYDISNYVRLCMDDIKNYCQNNKRVYDDSLLSEYMNDFIRSEIETWAKLDTVEQFVDHSMS